jgi:hypothetical protein
LISLTKKAEPSVFFVVFSRAAHVR